MGKHAIISIKNKNNEYLQYFEEKWDSYLFLNCKMENKDDVDSIYNFIENKFNISKDDVKCFFVGEKTHRKFSEKDKIEKDYTHYFYKIDLLVQLNIFEEKEFEYFNTKYKWFSYKDLMDDKRIQKVNSDVVSYIKEFNI